MKASEARKIATDVRTSKLNREYNKVVSKITEQVNSGNFVAVYDESLDSDTVEKLKSEGYKITYFQSGINEYSYEIKW